MNHYFRLFCFALFTSDEFHVFPLKTKEWHTQNLFGMARPAASVT